MSEYLSSLYPVARGRYLKRLEVLGLKENDDPYTEENSGRFIDDIASWLLNMDPPTRLPLFSSLGFSSPHDHSPRDFIPPHPPFLLDPSGPPPFLSGSHLP